MEAGLISSSTQMRGFENLTIGNGDIRLINETIDDSAALGMVSLTSKEWKNRIGKDAKKLFNPEERRKGIGTETLLTLLQFGFDELGLKRIITTVLDCSEASINLHKKISFVEEGRAASNNLNKALSMTRYHLQYLRRSL